MSECISSRGEYSSHEYENGECKDCGHVDLDRVRAEAKAEALREAADDLASESPFHHYADTEAHWQIGGKWADRLRARADELATS